MVCTTVFEVAENNDPKREKNDKLDFIKIKRYCLSKDQYGNECEIHKQGENIHTRYI